MRKIMFFGAIALLVAACKQEPRDYVTLSGTITNPNSDSLIISGRNGILKRLKVDHYNGKFKDTFKVETGRYSLYDGKEYTSIYLKNGYDINLKLDTKEFDETIKYDGIGAEPNNFLAKMALLKEKVGTDTTMFKLKEQDFNAKIETSFSDFYELLSNTGNFDSVVIANETKSIESLKSLLKRTYEQKQVSLALRGQDSPEFKDYENYAGGTTSLSDLKGKYVYIDLWATWCGPCKREIPFLKEIEKVYHNKNIVFVSISIDKPKKYEVWKKMVEEKELTGIQLYANEDKTFTDAYKVIGIPRFILIDPAGKVVNADAPRPSDPKLRTLIDNLL